MHVNLTHATQQVIITMNLTECAAIVSWFELNGGAAPDPEADMASRLEDILVDVITG